MSKPLDPGAPTPRATQNVQVTILHRWAFAAVKEAGSSTAALDGFIAKVLSEDKTFLVDLVGMQSIRERALGLLRQAAGSLSDGLDVPELEAAVAPPGKSKGSKTIAPAPNTLVPMAPSSVALAAAKRVGLAAAEAKLSAFERIRLPDGRPIGKITVGELGALARDYTKWALLANFIRKLGVADPNALVEDVVSEKKLIELHSKAEEYADAT